MTPLAHHLARILTLPLAKRGIFKDPAKSDQLRQRLTDTHCFEVTAIAQVVVELAFRIQDMGEAKILDLYGRYAFLPAPKTWLEMKVVTGRTAYSLEEVESNGWKGFSVWVCYDNKFCYMAAVCPPQRFFAMNPDLPEVFTKEAVQHTIALLLATLVLINSPKVFGRRTIAPHRGLEKQLTRSFGVGKFPLHAWTEIKLEVTKPPEIDDGEPHEAHLTGRRALHFCRKHVRIRLGQLEWVTSHWRGDPAIGIKRSRYTVEP